MFNLLPGQRDVPAADCVTYAMCILGGPNPPIPAARHALQLSFQATSDELIAAFRRRWPATAADLTMRMYEMCQIVASSPPIRPEAPPKVPVLVVGGREVPVLASLGDRHVVNLSYDTPEDAVPFGPAYWVVDSAGRRFRGAFGTVDEALDTQPWPTAAPPPANADTVVEWSLRKQVTR